MSSVRFDQHGWIRFGEGEQRWSAPDPTHEKFANAKHAARYPPPDKAPNYLVAVLADTYMYLVAVCPTTEDAVAKLREIRAAIRRKGDPHE